MQQQHSQYPGSVLDQVGGQTSADQFTPAMLAAAGRPPIPRSPNPDSWGPRPPDITPDEADHRRDPHAVADFYARTLDWPVVVDGGNVYLAANHGITGVVMRAGLAGEVQTMLKVRHSPGPVLAIPGQQPRWVFLTDLPQVIPAATPPGVEVVRPTRRIVLPPSTTAHGAVRWVNAPSLNGRRLANFTAVLQAVQSMARQETTCRSGRRC